jgi:hypothetical protein
MDRVSAIIQREDDASVRECAIKEAMESCVISLGHLRHHDDTPGLQNWGGVIRHSIVIC